MSNQLSQFFFDGKPRRKPVVSIVSANTQSLSREELLRQARLEREQRERERIEVAASLKIQATYRSYTTRTRIKNHVRAVFDRTMQDSLRAQRAQNATDFNKVDSSLVRAQCSRLCFVYCEKESKDAERIIWLSQQFLALQQQSGNSPSEIAKFINVVLIRRFLKNCLRCLRFIAPNTQIGFGPPLRTVEVYGFSDPATVEYVINGGFFETLRILLENRVQRADVEMGPSPMAHSLLDSMFVPIKLVGKNGGNQLSELLLLRMSQALFSPSASNQIVSLVLPAAVNAVKRGQIEIVTFAEVLLTRGKIAISPEVGGKRSAEGVRTGGRVARNRACRDTVEITPFLAYAALYLCESSEIASLSDDDRAIILLSLGTVVQALHSLVPVFSAHSEEDQSINNVRPVVPRSFEEWPQNTELQDAFLMNKCSELLGKACLVDGIFVQVSQTEITPEKVTALAEICHMTRKLKPFSDSESSLLYHLSFKSGFLRQLWNIILDCKTHSVFGEPKSMLDQLQRGLALSAEERNSFVPLIGLFCALFCNLLVAVHDDEFYKKDRPLRSLVPFSMTELRYICVSLRNLALGLIDLAFPDARPDIGENYRDAMCSMDVDYESQDRDGPEWSALFDVVVKLLVLLHERDARLQFCGRNFWSCHSKFSVNQRMFKSSRRGQARMFSMARILTMEEFEDGGKNVLTAVELRNLTILRQIPFVVPFDSRVQILQEMIAEDKIENGRNLDGWGGGFGGSIHIRVRRTHLYEDALDNLALENQPNLKKQIRVQMANWAGLDEAGIDGGGIFREFLAQLLKDGFDPKRGLFTSTPHEGLLYPNPQALIAYPDDFQRHYYFLGRILGKLIYENQLAELRFASFFLIKLLGRSSENVDIHHLESFDPILYKNLMYLKTYSENVRSLQLDFSVVVDELGVLKKINLKPNGQDIVVDNSNKIEYIHMVADFYLNRQIRVQTRAFLSGLSELIDLDWLGMFDYREMQILISGVDVEIDVDDLRRHTTVSGGLGSDQQTLEWFWAIVTEFSAEQRRKLLKFITSCSRPPLLGFKDLYPPLNVYLIPEKDRLPTAATCMNMLKLPQYSDKETLRSKLLYALESGEGFELS